jgi:hypothetical protein
MKIIGDHKPLSWVSEMSCGRMFTSVGSISGARIHSELSSQSHARPESTHPHGSRSSVNINVDQSQRGRSGWYGNKDEPVQSSRYETYIGPRFQRKECYIESATTILSGSSVDLASKACMNILLLIRKTQINAEWRIDESLHTSHPVYIIQSLNVGVIEVHNPQILLNTSGRHRLREHNVTFSNCAKLAIDLCGSERTAGIP